MLSTAAVLRRGGERELQLGLEQEGSWPEIWPERCGGDLSGRSASTALTASGPDMSLGDSAEVPRGSDMLGDRDEYARQVGLNDLAC